MKNDDAYRILLDGYREARLEQPLSPSYEIVYINGELYHLYDAYYYTLDGDAGTRQTCVLCDGYPSEAGFSIHKTGDDEATGKSASDVVTMTRTGTGSYNAILLDDCEVDMAYAGNSRIIPVNFRLLVKPSGSTSSTIVTYDHPLDFYNGSWGMPSGGDSGSGILTREPCVDDRYFSCSSAHFEVDECYNSYSSFFKDRYMYFNMSDYTYSYSGEIPRYRYEYAYSENEDDCWSNPKIVGKTQIGTYSVHDWYRVNFAIGSPADIVVGQVNVEDVEGVLSGTVIDNWSRRDPILAMAGVCGRRSGSAWDNCRKECGDRNSLTQYSWAVEKRVCEGLYKGGPVIQERYVKISRSYPDGQFDLGVCGYWSMKFGDCAQYWNEIVKPGPVELVGDPWICSAAPAAPGSETFPACPAQSQDCYRWYVIYSEHEYCSTMSCGEQVLKEKHWYKSLDITTEYYSGKWDDKSFEFVKTPYTVSIKNLDCVDCSGNPDTSKTAYAVTSTGVYKRKVVGYRRFEAVDMNGYTAEDKIEDILSSYVPDMMCPSGAADCGDCLKYVMAMGAPSHVDIEYGNYRFRPLNGVYDGVYVGNVMVDPMYSGWTWSFITLEYQMDMKDLLSLPDIGDRRTVLSSGQLHGESAHPEFIQEHGTTVYDNIFVPFSTSYCPDTDLHPVILRLFPPC